MKCPTTVGVKNEKDHTLTVSSLVFQELGQEERIDWAARPDGPAVLVPMYEGWDLIVDDMPPETRTQKSLRKIRGCFRKSVA